MASSQGGIIPMATSHGPGGNHTRVATGTIAQGGGRSRGLESDKQGVASSRKSA